MQRIENHSADVYTRVSKCPAEKPPEWIVTDFAQKGARASQPCCSDCDIRRRAAWSANETVRFSNIAAWLHRHKIYQRLTQADDISH
jgi:hypothetical protein